MKALIERITPFALPAILGFIAVASTGTASAQTTTAAAGLDCNGWSPISPKLMLSQPCVDPRGPHGGRFYDNGWYIGHDEPAVQFFSNRPGSGNNMVWRFRLPERDPVPNQSGTSVATFELTRGFVIGLALCDPASYPQNSCTPDSDSNTSLILPSDAGSAALELFFNPPGYPPILTSLSCDTTHWCAQMGINSLECDFNFNCNPNCVEPGDVAFIADNGTPTGPPSQQTIATFTPNAHTLLMNPGDDIVAIIRDTRDGVLNVVIDLTTGKQGFMVASAKNGFQNTDFLTCEQHPFSFHPEFSTASPQNGVPWASLFGNVTFFTEIGHFELGTAGDADADDTDCFAGPTVAGCLEYTSGGDLDFDGPSYQPDWPDGSKKHPHPVLIGALNGRGVGPMSSSPNGVIYSDAYPLMQFKTNVPNADANCNVSNGVGCVVPPTGAAFYPFYEQLGDGAGCHFTIGNDIPGSTTNDFGRDGEYGSYVQIGGFFGFGNFGPMFINPCTP